MAGAAVRIVIVDENKLYRTAVCSALRKVKNLQVVAKAEDGLAAIQAVERHRPDIVLMDISLQVINGLDAAWVIKSRFPGVKIILLTIHDLKSASEAAGKAGACCCLDKGCSPHELIQAIMAA
jgi:two-component system nitrate/nitrite response regulator NarL